MRNLLLISALSIITIFAYGQSLKDVTIAFYNLENLFDTIDSPDLGDFAWTPYGDKKWDTKRYNTKLVHLATVIADLDGEKGGVGPDIIGVAEVENKSVLIDLIKKSPLAPSHYGIVHYDSQDHRSIDVGLLYNKNTFKVLDSHKVPLIVNGAVFHTRDQLVVHGKLRGDEVYVIVNHWPSRRGGAERSESNRINAAHLCRSIADTILLRNSAARIVIIGDFNDNPTNKSIKNGLRTVNNVNILKGNLLYNAMENIYTSGTGTLCFHKVWFLFDQVIFSKGWFSGYSIINAEVYKADYIKVKKGKYKDHPYRTHAGRLYLGGYSDHFPVFVKLQKNK